MFWYCRNRVFNKVEPHLMGKKDGKLDVKVMYNLSSNWHSNGPRSSTISDKSVQSCIYLETVLSDRRFASVFISAKKNNE